MPINQSVVLSGPVSITCTGIIAEAAPSTRLLIQFADGEQLEFGSITGSPAWQDQISSMLQNAQTLDLARAMFLAWWLSRSADGSNAALIVGKTFTLDLSVASPIKVQ